MSGSGDPSIQLPLKWRHSHPQTKCLTQGPQPSGMEAFQPPDPSVSISQSKDVSVLRNQKSPPQNIKVWPWDTESPQNLEFSLPRGFLHPPNPGILPFRIE